VIKERSEPDLPEDEMSPDPERAPTNNNESESQPPPIVNERSPGKEKEHNNQSQENLRYYFPTSQGFFNGVVALFTALTCVVTYWQYQAQVVDQRAWVAVESIKTDPPVPEVGETLRIKVVFRNSGKTPARNTFTDVVVDPVTMPDAKLLLC